MRTKTEPHPRKVTSPPDARAALWVGAGIFLSRISGFVREAVFAFYFGASAVADVWRVALRTPNVIQNLLGEGTLSASFIPVYAEFLEEGREEDAGRFAGAFLGILSLVAGGLALLGVVAAPLIIRVLFFAWEPAMQNLAIQVTRILFPMTAILVVSAWALGVLNTHRKFFISYVAPVLWNVAIVTALVGLGTGLGWEASGRDADLVVGMAWGALAGGALQLAVQLPWVIRHLDHFRLSLDRTVEGIREAARNFVPVVTARGVVNVSGWIDMILAGLVTVGTISVLSYAQTLYVLPISLFALSVAASELPELSRRREAIRDVLAPRVSQALGRIAFLLIPSTLAYLFLGDVLTAALFERGDFERIDTLVVYGVLACYSLGLPATSSSRVLSSAFYAIRDTKTPAKAAYLRVALSIVVGGTLMFLLDRVAVGNLRLGAAGLALGASAAAWLEYGILRHRLEEKIGEHAPRRGVVVKSLMAGTLATGVAVFIERALPDVAPGSRAISSLLGVPIESVEALVRAVETVLPFGVLYVAVAVALGVASPRRTP